MPKSNHSKQILIGHVRYLSLSGQTSIFGGVFFVFKSLLGIERQKKLLKKFIFDPKTSEPCQNIDVSNVPKHRVMFVHVTFFCSQVFKTSVLDSEEKIVNITLIAFCSLAVTKLAHWPMSSLLWSGIGL